MPICRRCAAVSATAQGRVIAPDPATLPSDEFDFQTLWKHPKLLLAQTCWGPMEQGLAKHVIVVGQPSYDGIEGGKGELYSSAILMRRDGVAAGDVPSPADGRPIIPLDLMRGKRFAYNSLNSMSGIIALTRDLEAVGESLGHLLRAHRDRRASRLDRRGCRWQGRCLRDRRPQLGYGAALRAARGRTCRGRLDGAAQGLADDHVGPYAA